MPGPLLLVQIQTYVCKYLYISFLCKYLSALTAQFIEYHFSVLVQRYLLN